MTIRGYDIDGVLTHGIKPFGNICFAITGRSFEEADHTYAQFKEWSIKDCAIYFCPLPSKDITREKAAYWKANMIQTLGVTVFFEDDLLQADIILRQLPNLMIHMVRPDGTTYIKTLNSGY